MAIQRITSGIIADGAIVATDIGDGVVTASKIADANVTSSKLASTLSISGNFLANNITANTNIVANTGSAAAPSIFPTGDTNTGIFFPAADTIAFAEGGAEAMRIDSDGNVGIGTTSPSSFFSEARNLVVGTGTGGQGMTIYAGTGSQSRLFFADGTTGTDAYTGFVQYDHSSNVLTLGTNGGAERMRITAGGYFKASNNGTYRDSTGTYHEFRNTIDDVTLIVGSTSASTSTAGILFVEADRNTTNNTFYAISYYNRGATAYKFRVADSGNVTNTNNSYGSISDVKLKQDIVDAGSQWDDIKNLRVRKYHWKSEPDGFMQLGLVAQEAELVSPGLVEEHQDRDEEDNLTGETTKSVKYSILYMKAVKALQEAMERIETLEAKVAALEESQP
jgi:hypothetical protein